MHDFINHNYTTMTMMARYHQRNIGIEHIKRRARGGKSKMDFFVVRVPKQNTNGISLRKCDTEQAARWHYTRYMNETYGKGNWEDKYPCVVFEKSKI